MANVRRYILVWLASALIFAIAVGVSFRHLDVPLARYAIAHFDHPFTKSLEVKATILLGIEAIIFATLAVLRLLHGHLNKFSRALALACISSICAYAINSLVLKVVFGVPNVGEVLHGAPHIADLAGGSPYSSFPSGHMALAGAFAGVFTVFYRKAAIPIALALALGCGVLVMGTWHFLSDVLAGTFLGVSAGLLAGAIWVVHAEPYQRP